MASVRAVAAGYDYAPFDRFAGPFAVVGSTWMPNLDNLASLIFELAAIDFIAARMRLAKTPSSSWASAKFSRWAASSANPLMVEVVRVPRHLSCHLKQNGFWIAPRLDGV